MVQGKKQIRAAFRRAVFERDQYRCAVCKRLGQDRQGGNEHHRFHKGQTDLVNLDAHHITSRDIMPNGGYVKENGITVCDDCHLKAEGNNTVGFKAEDLYELIGSSYDIALKADPLS